VCSGAADDGEGVGEKQNEPNPRTGREAGLKGGRGPSSFGS